MCRKHCKWDVWEGEASIWGGNCPPPLLSQCSYSTCLQTVQQHSHMNLSGYVQETYLHVVEFHYCVLYSSELWLGYGL